MAATAGQIAEAGRIPGERIATTTVTSDSSTFTTSESAALASVTASLVSGRTYRVRFVGRWGSTVADDQVRARLREDDATGTLANFSASHLFTNSASGNDLMLVEAEFTASSTGSKTFVITGQRTAGSGSCRLDAEAAGPAFLYVDFIR